jgi:DNA-binding GntR family transcriptional regulator
MILTGELEPGQRLIEREIADRLGVSRTPLRECIRKLESEGLVEHLPRKGCVVRRVSVSEVVEVFMIRSSLEPLASRLAAERRTPRDVARMKKILTELQSAVVRGDQSATHDFHVLFHDTIFRVARSPRLAGMLKTLMHQSFWYARVAYSIPGRTEQAQVEHAALLEAIEAGDSDLAESRSREHVNRSKAAYLSIQSMVTNA